MAVYVQSMLELAEQSSSPGAPDTGMGILYFKSDGNLYIKDDTGAETQLTGSSSGGIDRHYWSPKECNFNVAAESSYTNAVATPTMAMPNGDNSSIVTPKWRVTQGLIDEIAAGKKLFLGVDCESSLTGDVGLVPLLELWDESANAFAAETLAEATKTITASSEMHHFTFEFTTTPELGDLIAFQLTRKGGTDAHSGTLHVTGLCAFADTGAGS